MMYHNNGNQKMPKMPNRSNEGTPPSTESTNGQQISPDTRCNFGRRGDTGNLPQGDREDRTMPSARVIANRNVEKGSY